MMLGKNTLMASVAAGTLALSSIGASAQGGLFDAPYISVFGGVSFLEDIDTTYDGNGLDYSVETDDGFVVGVAVGAQVFNNVRGELEFAFSEHDGDQETDVTGVSVNGDIQTYYLLANAWYDFKFDSMFQPYVGGGLGIGFVDGNTTFGASPFGYGGSDEGFAFQVGGGVRVALSEMISFDVSYRFRSILDVDFADSDGVGNYENGDIYSHNIQGGLTIHFGGM